MRNRPFVDGNKRTGFLMGVLFLEMNRWAFTVGELTQALDLLSEEMGRAHALKPRIPIAARAARIQSNGSASKDAEENFKEASTSWKDLTLGQVIANSRMIRSQSRPLRAEAAKISLERVYYLNF